MISNNFDPLIKAHIVNYSTLLEQGIDVPIDKLISTFIAMHPIVHKNCDQPVIDIDALSFALARLPSEIHTINKVLFVQSYEDIKSIGFDITKWQRITSPGRRRLTFINPSRNTLACLLSSPSDIHDVINCLISYEIEKRKISTLINNNIRKFSGNDFSFLGLDEFHLEKLQRILGENWKTTLNSITLNNPMVLKMYGRQEPLYQLNSSNWMKNLVSHSLIVGLDTTPIYFVSSNSHSIVNIISGFINSRQSYIFDYISRINPKLFEQWLEVKRKNNISKINDFIYYVSTDFLKNNPQMMAEKQEFEKSMGIININSSDAFQSNTQLIPVSAIAKSAGLDSNLHGDVSILAKSNAYILNIEYPLGYAAYHLLHEIFNTFFNLQAIYILGKAAILTGNVGDIQIPERVIDEMSGNHYQFNNVFNSLFNFKTYISNVFTNQKEACVYGTYLESHTTVDTYTSLGVNVIEMENGPYLKALTEHVLLHDSAASENTEYDLTQIPLEIGVINYASDNPLVQNLTQESTSLLGVESVYLASVATLQRIIDLETQRLSSNAPQTSLTTPLTQS